MNVKLVDSMGSDLSVVNAARVSFGARSEGMTDKDRGLIRYLMANSSPEKVDKQGRVMVNPWLREYAGLGREVVVTGALDHIEIWTPEGWDRMQDLTADDFANIDGPIGSIGA